MGNKSNLRCLQSVVSHKTEHIFCSLIHFDFNSQINQKTYYSSLESVFWFLSSILKIRNWMKHVFFLQRFKQDWRKLWIKQKFMVTEIPDFEYGRGCCRSRRWANWRKYYLLQFGKWLFFKTINFFLLQVAEVADEDGNMGEDAAEVEDEQIEVSIIHIKKSIKYKIIIIIELVPGNSWPRYQTFGRCIGL